RVPSLRPRPDHRAPVHVRRNRRARGPGARPTSCLRLRGVPHRPVARDRPPLTLRLRRGPGPPRAGRRRLRHRAPGGRAGCADVRQRGAGAGRRHRPGRAVEVRRALVPLHALSGGGRTHAHPEPPHREGAADVTLATLALTESVKARALALGFDRVAVGPAGPADHAERFEQWLDAGYAGEMDYLARTRAERGDPARLLPGCRSVIAVALAYGPRQDDPSWAPVSLYARGGDYHDLMRGRLLALATHLREAGGPSIESRAAVDTSAVLERDLAARAGLGWIGKNTNLIAPGGGSYFF